MHSVLDSSTFADLFSSPMGCFRLYSQFAVFTYSQLQSILSDQTLGSISDWDHFLNLNLDEDNLTFKTRSEFLQNKDFAELVNYCKLPTPSRFVDQCMAFYRSFCQRLLEHDIKNSDLIRGLSCFDTSVMLDSPESHYRDCVERLASFFSESGWIPATTKSVIVSQYRSLVTKLRVDGAQLDDWFSYLSAGHEMRCRPELHQLFKFSCLCISQTLKKPNEFLVNFPTMKGGSTELDSCVKSLQLAFVQMPDVSSLFSSVENISSLFPLIRQGPSMLADRKFSAWNLTKPIISRRLAIYTQLEGRYIKSSSREELALLASDTSSSNSASVTVSPAKVPGPSSAPAPVSLPLAKATLSVARVSTDPNFLKSNKEVTGKMGKKSKKSPSKN